jgi:hypothetical protein
MTIQINQNYKIETANMSTGEKIVTVWRAMKLNADSVFMVKVLKNGQLAKPGVGNMMTAPFTTLQQGVELGNFYAA